MRTLFLLIIISIIFHSCSSSEEKSTGELSSEETNYSDSLKSPDAVGETTRDKSGEPDYSGVIISGKLESIKEGIVFLEANQQGQYVKIASADIDSLGRYVIKSDNLQFDYVYNLTYPKNRKAFIYLDTNRISIDEVDKKFVVGGSEESKYYNGYMSIVLNYSTTLSDLNKSYQYYANSGNQKEAEKVREKFQTLNDKRLEELKSYLSTIPASMTLMNGVLEYVDDADNHVDFLKSAVSKMQKTDKALENKEEFIQHVNPKLMLAIGNNAPDFKLPTPEGSTIKLSSLRGKYVLIDFWASWCGPCRAENPNVVKVYNKYKNDGFEILGVSLDKDKDKWLEAIAKDGLVWKHGSDLKFWQSEAAQMYGVTGIPFTLLIDSKGKILAKNLRGQALEEKLKSIFKH